MNTDIKNPALRKPAPAEPNVVDYDSPLFEFFVEALKDIYWAEQQLVKALPKLEAAATTDYLASSIKEHLLQTEDHVKRIERAFSFMGLQPEAKVCHAMQGLIRESESILEETDPGSMTRDAAIIMAAQKVEHYEIATYGSLVEYAKMLGMNEVRGLLQLTLDEELMANNGLTRIAQNKINWEAELE